MKGTDRAAKSRQDLLGATTRLISEKGLSGVRIREIASGAGLSPAGVLYHYPETDALMIDVHRMAVDAYMAGRESAAESREDPRHRLVRAFITGIPPYADTDVIRLLFEMHSLARRSSVHAELMTGLWRSELANYASIVESGTNAGVFAPRRPGEDVAAMLLAMEDGLALHLISGNARLTAERVTELFLRFAEDELGCAGLVEIGRSFADEGE